MEINHLKTKEEIKMKKKCSTINFRISVKYYLTFIFTVILIMLFLLNFIVFSLIKLSKAHRKEALSIYYQKKFLILFK